MHAGIEALVEEDTTAEEPLLTTRTFQTWAVEAMSNETVQLLSLDARNQLFDSACYDPIKAMSGVWLRVGRFDRARSTAFADERRQQRPRG